MFEGVKMLAMSAALISAPQLVDAQNEMTGALALPANEGGARRVVVSSGNTSGHLAPSADAEVATTFDQGTVLRNQGCSVVEGQSWCKLRPLRSSKSVFVLADQVVPVLNPDGTPLLGPNDSRRRAGAGAFDAVSDIACAQEQGQTLGTCNVSVARAGGGDATVVVRFPNGFKRQLYFIQHQFIRASATMSGVGTDMEWSLNQGVYAIRVDDQRFEIEARFVSGP